MQDALAITTVFPAPAPVTLAVQGRTARFPVRHVYCVGRNYAEHAREMGGDASREPPFFFTKAADCVLPVVPPAVGTMHYPIGTQNLHHELELVVAVGARGIKRTREEASALVWGYAIGLDMTRRDLQNDMREKKRPWDIGKSFAEAAPTGPVHPVADTGVLARGAVTLDVNGQRRQAGDLAQMIWDVPEMLAFLSQYYELMPGDLVFTGTPAGVGPVRVGDRLDAAIEGLGTMSVVIGPPLA